MTTLCFALPRASYGAERNSPPFSARPHRNMDKSGCISSVNSSAAFILSHLLRILSISVRIYMNSFMYAIIAYLFQGQSLESMNDYPHPDLLSPFPAAHRPPAQSFWLRTAFSRSHSHTVPVVAVRMPVAAFSAPERRSLRVASSDSRNMGMSLTASRKR